MNDDALEAVRRQSSYEEMASAEAMLRADPAAWTAYAQERDEWLASD